MKPTMSAKSTVTSSKPSAMVCGSRLRRSAISAGQHVAQEPLGLLLFAGELGGALLDAVLEDLVRARELFERARQAAGHVVERAGERAELVGALGERQVRAEVLFVEVLGRPRERPHRPREEAGREPHEQQHDDVTGEEHADDAPLRLAPDLVDVARVVVAPEQRDDLAQVILDGHVRRHPRAEAVAVDAGPLGELAGVPRLVGRRHERVGLEEAGVRGVRDVDVDDVDVLGRRGRLADAPRVGLSAAHHRVRHHLRRDRVDLLEVLVFGDVARVVGVAVRLRDAGAVERLHLVAVDADDGALGHVVEVVAEALLRAVRREPQDRVEHRREDDRESDGEQHDELRAHPEAQACARRGDRRLRHDRSA